MKNVDHFYQKDYSRFKPGQRVSGLICGFEDFPRVAGVVVASPREGSLGYIHIEVDKEYDSIWSGRCNITDVKSAERPILTII